MLSKIVRLFRNLVNDLSAQFRKLLINMLENEYIFP